MTATANLPLSPLADSVIVNYQGNTRRMTMTALGLLLGNGGTGDGAPLAAEVLARQQADAEIMANIGKIYPDRATPVAAGRNRVPAEYGRIITIEDGGFAVRGPGQTADDPLFGEYPNWGVLLRIPGLAALMRGGIIPLVITGGVPNWPVAAPQGIFAPLLSTIANTDFVSVIFAAGNTGPVQITIAGISAASPVLGADGQPLTGGEIVGGRGYILQRRGTNWRIVLGDVTLAELLAERLERIAVDAQTGTVALESVAGTGNAITASVPSMLSVRGISAANLRRISFVAVADNNAAVTINIDGVGAVDLRSPTGAPLAAGRIQTGRIYTAAKIGSRWHLVSGEVTAGDLTVERNATINNFGAAGITRLVNIGGTVDAITADIPAGGSDLGATGNGHVVMFRPIGTNTSAAPTLQIAGGPVRTLYSETNGTLGSGRLVPNTWHVVLLASNGNAQVQGIYVKPSELPSLRETLTSTTALANTLSNSVARLEAKAVLEYAMQTGNALPSRPNAPVVHWLTWTDPSALMGPADMWFQLPSPTVPDMPSEPSWRWRNSRTGTSGVLQILSVPAASPPITAVQYRLDGGAWTSVPAVPSEVTVPGLTLAQTYAMEIRYLNFVGAGVPTIARTIAVSDASFSDNFNRVDQNLSNDARWLDVVVGNAGRRGTIFSNAVRPPSTNETYVMQVQEYFAPDQAVEAQILGGGINTGAGRGAMLYVRMPTGENSGYRLRIMGNAWVLSRILNGVTVTLASGTHANVYPVQARLVAQGNVITATIGGTVVATVTDNDPAAFTRGTVGLGVSAAGADGAGSIRIDNFTAGNV